MKKTLIHIHHTIWITFIFFLMLIAVLISAARLATPWLAEQKPFLEKWAGTLLEQPVKINQLAINWEGFQPVLRCHDVIIFNDANTQPLLRVHELAIGVSLIKTIITGHFRLGHLRINGLHLTLRENKDGRITIIGINAPLAGATGNTNSDALNEIVAWLFAEPEIALQDVSLTWYDKNNTILPIKGLDFIIKNSGHQHVLSGQAQLAQTIASQLNFTIKIKGDWQDQKALNADVYVKAQDILLTQWAARLNIPAVNIQQGQADFELWGQWQKQHWQNWQSLFALKETAFTVSVKNKTTPAIAIQHLSGNVSWQPAAQGGWQLTGNHLQLVFADNVPWEDNHFALTINPEYTHQQWQLSYINLTQLVPVLIKTQILPAAWQNALIQLQPEGVLRNTQFHYQAAATADTSGQYSIDTQFEQLAAKRWRSLPGVSNLTGQLQLTPDNGRLLLNSRQVQLDFGKLFRAPLYLDRLTVQADWQQTADGWHIKATQARAQNADADINTQFYLFMPADQSKPYLSLLAGYQLFSAQHIANYLPLTELSPDLVKWLSTAILRIAHAQGTLVINGDLKDYPFADNNGTFIVDSQIDDADLAYWPQWPLLKHFSGELVFTGPGMQILAQSGQLFSSKIKQLTATIPMLKKGVPAILQIDGQLTGNLTDALRFLQESPLYKTLKSGVDNLTAQGPLQLQISLTVPLEHADPIKVNGQIDTQNAVVTLPKWNLQLPNLQGRFNFTEAGLNAQNLTATLWEKPVTLQIVTLDKQQGMQIQAAGQVAVKDIQQQFNTKLLNAMTGESDYLVTLHVADKTQADDVHIQSDLKGISVDLPVPLAKTADQSRNFEFITPLKDEQAFNNFIINYGDLSAAVNKRPASWLINLQSPQIAGSVIWPAAKNTAIQANLQRLYLTPANTAGADNLQPQDVPDLYLNCQDLRYADKQFGAVVVNLKTTPNGVAINQLQAVAPFFKLVATGSWRGNGQQNWSVLSGVLTSPDIAVALASLNLPIAGFTTKDSRIDFALQWKGAPYAPSLAKLNGNVALNLKEGQITEVGADNPLKMNVGRLLTFMSWQSIARRLHLDFSDLTQHGYSFNILKGEFILANGNAITNNTYLDGPMAKVTVKGRIGLAVEDFDMQLGVTPHLSSNLLLLAGIAGGPVAGLATGAASWLAGKMFSNQMGKIITDNYRLTGPWSKPQVIHEENKLVK